MSTISTWVKARIPDPVKSVVRGSRLCAELVRDYLSEAAHFIRHSHGVSNTENRQKSRYALLKAYHGVEKGLSIGQRRPGFGQVKIIHLIRKLRRYVSLFGIDETSAAAIASLKHYEAVQEQDGADITKLKPHLDTLRTLPEWQSVALQEGGTQRVTRQAILESVKGCGAEFFLSRHSLRNFRKDPVPIDLIEEAVRRATKTPSVCNRQAPRVYCFADAARVLALQPGNAGFGHNAAYAIVVTSDVSAFSGSGERHQTFIDGGMFAMSLLYAFHSLGLGACPLAWNASFAHESAVKRKLHIGESEAIVMFMAVGAVPDEFEAAVAKRLSLDTWLTYSDEEMPNLRA